MKVTMIGTGYVGLVSGTCFAEIGHNVCCVDLNESKIAMLKDGKSPIYEPGLNELLEKNIKAKRLSFTTGNESIKDAKIIFIAVDTPPGENGAANLTNLLKASKTVGEHLGEETFVVIKSTVPMGTSEKVRNEISKVTTRKFTVINNPEFLKEGSAIEDFMRPDRIIIGCKDDSSFEIMEKLYAPLVRQGNPIIRMSNISAELTKYAANCFLATKISFINEMANLCDMIGADIEEVRKGIVSDVRIGKHFLFPGIGFGGSCFPKDVQALLNFSKDVNTQSKIIESTWHANEFQKQVLYKKIEKHYKNDLKGRVFAFWGVAFKPNTDDIREAPSLYIARSLIERGAKINIYDPVAEKNFINEFADKKNNITVFEDKYECLRNADALCLLTEWMEFRHPDFYLVEELLKEKVIFDGRNIFSPSALIKIGFTYYGIGRNSENK